MANITQGMIIALGLLKLAVLMLWALPGTTAPRTKLTLAAAALNFVVVLPLSVLSYFEHALRVAPSFIIELYLLLTILFDVVRVRTLWLMPASVHTALAAAETATLVVKVVLALVEAARKDQLVFPNIRKKYTLEQLAGFYGRSMFFWLGSTLWNGLSLPFPSSEKRTNHFKASLGTWYPRICPVPATTSRQSCCENGSGRAGRKTPTRPPKLPCSGHSSSLCRESFSSPQFLARPSWLSHSPSRCCWSA